MSLFSTRHSEQAVDLFAKQFTFEHGRWVFRRKRKEAPRPVEEAEVEHFVDQYRDRLTLTAWGGAAIVIGTMVLLSLFPDPVDMTTYIVSAAVELLGFAAIQQWIYNAPARELERRPQVGMPLRSGEYSAKVLRDLKYSQLLVMIAAGAALAYGGYINIDEGKTFWYLWIAAGVLSAAFGTVQLVRKFLLDEGEA